MFTLIVLLSRLACQHPAGLLLSLTTAGLSIILAWVHPVASPDPPLCLELVFAPCG